MDHITRFLEHDDGVTAVEYGLIIALVAVVIMGAITVLGTSLRGFFETLSDYVK